MMKKNLHTLKMREKCDIFVYFDPLSGPAKTNSIDLEHNNILALQGDMMKKNLHTLKRIEKCDIFVYFDPL